MTTLSPPRGRFITSSILEREMQTMRIKVDNKQYMGVEINKNDGVGLFGEKKKDDMKHQ